jgi:hypothetical protein
VRNPGKRNKRAIVMSIRKLLLLLDGHVLISMTMLNKEESMVNFGRIIVLVEVQRRIFSILQRGCGRIESWRGNQMQQQNQSEVARVLQTIEQAYQSAKQGLHGYAIVGPHRHRTQQTELICQGLEELQSLVGETKAIELVAEVLNKQ